MIIVVGGREIILDDFIRLDFILIRVAIKRRKVIVILYSFWGCLLFIKRFSYFLAFIFFVLKR